MGQHVSFPVDHQKSLAHIFGNKPEFFLQPFSRLKLFVNDPSLTGYFFQKRRKLLISVVIFDAL